MSLKKIGFVTCPSCGESATAGISRDGAGKAIHVICTACTTQVQTTRTGVTGKMIVEYAIPTAVESRPDLTPFDVWEFELMDLVAE